jgi:hypothetical protein
MHRIESLLVKHDLDTVGNHFEKLELSLELVTEFYIWAITMQTTVPNYVASCSIKFSLFNNLVPRLSLTSYLQLPA